MKRFFIIFAGQAASLLGSELVQFALIWWLTKTEGTASALAVAAALALLPSILLGPFIGALIDRKSRKAVMIAADSAVAAVSLALAVLFVLGAARKEYVYAAIFARALGGAFHWPAMQAATAILVPRPRLARVAGMNQTLRGAVGFAMPPLGAVLVVLCPIPVVLAVDIVTAAFAVATLAAVNIPDPEKNEKEGDSSLWSEMGEGARYILRRPGLAILIALIAILHFLAAPAFALLPVVAKNMFRGGAFEMAWMQSASGLGLLSGGIALGVWGGFRRRVVTVLAGLISMGLCLAAIGSLKGDAFTLALPLIFAAGACASMTVGSFQAIQQSIVPQAVQGRVFAISRSGIDAMSPFGMAAAGPFADRLGLNAWYLAAGLAMTVTATAAAAISPLRRIETKE